MTNSFVACALALTVTAAAPALVSSQGQKPTDSVAVAMITKLEHEAIKAVLANDSSFFEKFLAMTTRAVPAAARGTPSPPLWRT